MPAVRAKCGSKKCVNKAVSANIHELVHHGTRKRSHRQIVAIAIAESKAKKKK